MRMTEEEIKERLNEIIGGLTKKDIRRSK